jgi:hypothetical protein
MGKSSPVDLDAKNKLLKEIEKPETDIEGSRGGFLPVLSSMRSINEWRKKKKDFLQGDWTVIDGILSS